MLRPLKFLALPEAAVYAEGGIVFGPEDGQRLYDVDLLLAEDEPRELVLFDCFVPRKINHVVE